MAQKDLSTEEKVELALVMLDYIFTMMAETVPSFHADMESLMTSYIDSGKLAAASKTKVKAEIISVKDVAKGRTKST
jgi:hypothetical protein